MWLRHVAIPLRFLHRVPCVAGMFFVTAVVRDALDDDLGIVTAGESAFSVSPIVLGLTLVVAGAVRLGAWRWPKWRGVSGESS